MPATVATRSGPRWPASVQGPSGTVVHARVMHPSRETGSCMAYKAVRHVQTTGHGRERTESLAGRRSLARPLLCQSERAAVSGEAERIDPDSRRAGRWAITHPCLPLQDGGVTSQPCIDQISAMDPIRRVYAANRICTAPIVPPPPHGRCRTRPGPRNQQSGWGADSGRPPCAVRRKPPGRERRTALLSIDRKTPTPQERSRGLDSTAEGRT
jgi:hypothetical protein